MLVQLSPPPGLNSDDTTFGAQRLWADGSNVRFVGGRAQSIGGSLLQHGDAVQTGIAAADLFIIEVNDTIKMLYGIPGGVLLAGTGLASPTSIGGSGSNAGWSFASFGSTLLAASRGQRLYEWGGAGAATEVAEAPDEISAILVTPERQVLALGANEEASGNFNPLCIRGSDLEDYSSVGSWTTSSSNNAFEHVLEGGGEILAGAMVGPYVAVWTTTSLYLGQFLGEAGQAYRFDRVDDRCGIAGPRAFCVMDQIAWWLTTDFRLMRWSPGTAPAEIACPIGREFRDNMPIGSSVMNTFLVARASRGEIWICHDHMADPGTTPTRYIAYAIRESLAAQAPVWFRGELARSAMIDSPLLIGLDAAGSPFSVDADGNAWLDDVDGQGTAPGAFIESADFYLDESARRVMVRRFVPDFEYQTPSVSLTLSLRDWPMAAATVSGPHALPAGAAKKDLRATARIVSARLSWDSGHVRLGKPLFDVVPLGER